MGRQRCARCERPASVCLCQHLPSPPLRTTRTKVVLLQHPHEARHKLSTVPVLSRCLAHCHILHGRRFQEGCSPLLDLFLDSQPISQAYALLLFPTTTAQPIDIWYDQVARSDDLQGVINQRKGVTLIDGPTCSSATRRLPFSNIEKGTADFLIHDSILELKHSSLSPQGSVVDSSSCQHVSGAHDVNPGIDFPQIVLIAVDATWQHAKEMIKASAPYLGKFVVPVCLPFDPGQEGSCMATSESIIRKEPFKGCMTTLEAIACCLKILEPNGVEIHNALLHVLRCMVKFQASNIISHKVRMSRHNKSTDTIFSGDMSQQ